LEQSGRRDEARQLLTQVAKDRTYYAFLAAERAGVGYYLEDKPLAIDPLRLDRLAESVGARRVEEWLALGRKGDARREWRSFTAGMERADLELAAKLAQRWGWLDQAIWTLSKADSWDDLELRFPVRYLSQVEHQADQHGLGAAWVLAVIRQESLFAEDARSGAGALGLMQLMPATAGSLARQPGGKKKKFNPDSLLEPDTNIPLGTSYLSQLYRRLNRHPVLATAAYNAGPGRVQRWLPARTQEADIWVENIPFNETRDYVRRVMSYALIYEQRLGHPPGSILERMRPIEGSEDRTSTLPPEPESSS
jgi:soluble lytic murein transglycosylase